MAFSTESEALEFAALRDKASRCPRMRPNGFFRSLGKSGEATRVVGGVATRVYLPVVDEVDGTFSTPSGAEVFDNDLALLEKEIAKYSDSKRPKADRDRVAAMRDALDSAGPGFAQSAALMLSPEELARLRELAPFAEGFSSILNDAERFALMTDAEIQAELDKPEPTPPVEVEEPDPPGLNDLAKRFPGVSRKDLKARAKRIASQ